MIAVSGLRKSLKFHAKTLVFRRAETHLRNRGKTKPKSIKFHRNDLKSMQITWKYAVEMIAVSGLRKHWKSIAKPWFFEGRKHIRNRIYIQNEKYAVQNEKPKVRMKKPGMRMKKPGMRMR